MVPVPAAGLRLAAPVPVAERPLAGQRVGPAEGAEPPAGLRLVELRRVEPWLAGLWWVE
ncbi:hypothetical protein GCM10017710_18810 [Arthrobacter ramosus]